ncbi:hypothetical protein PoB_001507300 [Plakobranchus ocellatus]|uniref:Uncharacterized protein n=1 Tax=Plakobranchus ocellatus TaxID=259542 RepID=A0AAV3Z234_9GAST|nr:hypothetical protein PoB_001507300 [Plakobranchus ocellatus]
MVEDARILCIFGLDCEFREEQLTTEMTDSKHPPNQTEFGSIENALIHRGNSVLICPGLVDGQRFHTGVHLICSILHSQNVTNFCATKEALRGHRAEGDGGWTSAVVKVVCSV